MVTAYDYPSALHADRAGIDVVLVGDSVAMVALGHETTQPVTLDQMLHHCQAVKRGAPARPLLVGDLPFGSYEFTDGDVALAATYRLVKEGGVDAVKLEVRLPRGRPGRRSGTRACRRRPGRKKRVESRRLSQNTL